jgi:hypothetical protein
MDTQSVIKILFEEIRKHEHLLDKEKTKIFLPNHFASRLEFEMGIKDIKKAGLAGYSVQYGPFPNISAFNKDKKVSVVLSENGELIT